MSERDRQAMRKVAQSTRFAKAKKRLYTKEQLVLDDEVKKIIENPLIGEAKSGPLPRVRVLKYKVGRQLWLLAYEYNEKRNVIELLDLGAHENFYKDLKDYRDAR